jgi:hypothetical protein
VERHIITVDGLAIEGMTDELQAFLNRNHPWNRARFSGAGDSIVARIRREEWEKEAGVSEALA